MSFGPSVRPSVCRQGFRNILKKIIGSIHIKHGIYPYVMSLLTPNHFSVPGLIFGPLMAKYLAKNGVSRTFLKKQLSNSFDTWYLLLWGETLDPDTFLYSWTHFRPPGGQILGRKWGLWKFLKKLLAQFILYLAFILIGWVAWPLYIFVFLASFSAHWWPNVWPTAK